MSVGCSKMLVANWRTCNTDTRENPLASCNVLLRQNSLSDFKDFLSLSLPFTRLKYDVMYGWYGKSLFANLMYEVCMILFLISD
jgi:hypothetical protein